MMGSETFIIVALRWSEKRTPSFFAFGHLLGEEGAKGLPVMNVASKFRRP